MHIIDTLSLVLLLVKFWRQRLVFQQNPVHGVMSTSLLTKLLVFCLYRLILTV